MKDIIFLGGINLTYRVQRTYHFAKRFADEHRVFYINPWLGGYSCLNLKGNLNVVTLQGSGQVKHKMDDPKGVVESLKDFFRKEKINDFVFFVQFPYWYPIVEQFSQPIVFDCLDEYIGFHDLVNIGIEKREILLFKNADLVLCSANILYERAKKYNEDSIVINNACDPHHFDIGYNENKKRDVVGYVGCIADWFDQELVVEVAEIMPEVTFRLIGAVSVDVTELKRRPNIELLGEIPYRQLPEYMRYFDVCIVPFKHRLPIIKSCDPVKMYEYLATGRPVVSTPIDEVVRFGDEFIYIGETPEDWKSYIIEGLENVYSINYRNKNKSLVKNETWDSRFEQLYSDMRVRGIL